MKNLFKLEDPEFYADEFFTASPRTRSKARLVHLFYWQQQDVKRKIELKANLIISIFLLIWSLVNVLILFLGGTI